MRQRPGVKCQEIPCPATAHPPLPWSPPAAVASMYHGPQNLAASMDCSGSSSPHPTPGHPLDPPMELNPVAPQICQRLFNVNSFASTVPTSGSAFALVRVQNLPQCPAPMASSLFPSPLTGKRNAVLYKKAWLYSSYIQMQTNQKS